MLTNVGGNVKKTRDRITQTYMPTCKLHINTIFSPQFLLLSPNALVNWTVWEENRAKEKPISY